MGLKMLKIPSRKSNCGAAAARVRRAAMAATEVDMSLDYLERHTKR